MRDFDDPASAVNILVGKGFVEAAYTRWTLGDRIYGDERKGRFLARLRSPPPEIWEIRITEPSVQARAFARFAAPDTLIVMKTHARQLLGNRRSPQWGSAMSDCEKQWSALFPTFDPFCGETIHDYVTRNCDDFPI